MIAAGEVVERPLSVVKELVENSIDSGANIIQVSLQRSGFSSIFVHDNGSGMPKEDLELCGVRHATSKIEAYEELRSLNSLGFRGEALPSIVTMAQKVVVRSSTGAYENGYEKCFVSGQSTGEALLCSIKGGTSIEVLNLFYEHPARLSAQVTPKTEFAVILDYIKKVSMTYSNIRFTLMNNGKESFRTYGQSQDLRVFVDAYGVSNHNNVVPIDASNPLVSVKGFLTNNKESRKTKKNQLLTVNKRIVSNPELHKSINEAVRKYLPPGTFPQYSLHLALNPNLVDVNVHPRKERVLLRADCEVDEYLHEVIQKALRVEREELQERVVEVEGESASLHIIGQLDNTYILASYNNQLLLVDQHAAHETILFHLLSQEYGLNTDTLIENSLPPDRVSELSPSVHVKVDSLEFENSVTKKALLNSLGFEYDSFGDRDIIIRTKPSILPYSDVSGVFLKLLQGALGKYELLYDLIAEVGCKSAIKAGEELSDETMHSIVSDMFSYHLTNCPHGRPLYTAKSLLDIHKEFKRVL